MADFTVAIEQLGEAAAEAAHEMNAFVSYLNAYAPSVIADFERDSGSTVDEIHELERIFNV